MRRLLLLCAAAASEWVEWPAGQAVPEGASTRININTNNIEVDVDINATLLEHRYRTTVNEATRLEDTTANLTRRETMISALRRRRAAAGGAWLQVELFVQRCSSLVINAVR